MTPIRLTVALLLALIPAACDGTSPATSDADTSDAQADAGPAGDAAGDSGDAAKTCTDQGHTYAIGAIIRRSDCASCQCLEGGVVGHCTGFCPI